MLLLRMLSPKHAECALGLHHEFRFDPSSVMEDEHQPHPSASLLENSGLFQAPRTRAKLARAPRAHVESEQVRPRAVRVAQTVLPQVLPPELRHH